MKVILISTTILDESSYEKVKKLRCSLNDSNNETVFKHFFLFQNTKEIPEEFAKLFDIDDMLYSSSDILSLSKARNFLLANVRDLIVNTDIYDYIAFPDDDAWYTDGVFCLFKFIDDNEFKKDVDFIVTKYSVSTEGFMKDKIDILNKEKLISSSSSNTIFLSSRIFLEIGFFNEHLGVGATYNGGEDLDFAIRAYSISKKCLFIDQFLVGHRNKNKAISHKYYAGSYLAICNGVRILGVSFLSVWFRKLVIGLFYILTKRMSLKYFIKLNINAIFPK